MSPHTLLTSASTTVEHTGFAGAMPGGRLMVLVGVAGLLLIGLLAVLVSVRDSRLGTEGARRARRGFGPDALDAAAGELRPSLTDAAALRPRQIPGPVRIPRHSPAPPPSSVMPPSSVIPEEVRAWQQRRESR